MKSVLNLRGYYASNLVVLYTVLNPNLILKENKIVMIGCFLSRIWIHFSFLLKDPVYLEGRIGKTGKNT